MEIDSTPKEIFQTVCLKFNLECKLDHLAKQLASSSIIVAELEENELDHLAKQLASTSVAVAEKEVNELDHLAKQLASSSIVAAEMEVNKLDQLAKQLASSSIVVAEKEVNKLDQLAKQLASNSIVVAESEVNEINQLAKQPASSSIVVVESAVDKIDRVAEQCTPANSRGEEDYQSHATQPQKQRQGGLEVLSMLSDTDQIKELIHQFKANGAKSRNIPEVADEFVCKLFHGFFYDDDKEANEEATSLIQFVTGRVLQSQRCNGDNALLAKLDGMVDEVFDVVDSLLSSVASAHRNNHGNDSNIQERQWQLQREHHQQHTEKTKNHNSSPSVQHITKTIVVPQLNESRHPQHH